MLFHQKFRNSSSRGKIRNLSELGVAQWLQTRVHTEITQKALKHGVHPGWFSWSGVQPELCVSGFPTCGCCFAEDRTRRTRVAQRPKDNWRLTPPERQLSGLFSAQILAKCMLLHILSFLVSEPWAYRIGPHVILGG